MCSEDLRFHIHIHQFNHYVLVDNETTDKPVSMPSRATIGHPVAFRWRADSGPLSYADWAVCVEFYRSHFCMPRFAVKLDYVLKCT